MTVYRSAKVLENNLRALEAGDEALKLRNTRDTPIEYANTIANKSNVPRNLPADTKTNSGQSVGEQAAAPYREPRTSFKQSGLDDRAKLLVQA
jgi:hypothetical protein